MIFVISLLFNHGKIIKLFYRAWTALNHTKPRLFSHSESYFFHSFYLIVVIVQISRSDHPSTSLILNISSISFEVDFGGGAIELMRSESSFVEKEKRSSHGPSAGKNQTEINRKLQRDTHKKKFIR